MARKPAPLPPPYLKRLWFDSSREIEWNAYPFHLPIFRRGEFELEFETQVTILVGENGTGKSTRIGEEAEFQIVTATHSPLLMAYPGATLLRIQGDALLPVGLEDTDHFRPFRDFCEDPKYFVDVWLVT